MLLLAVLLSAFGLAAAPPGQIDRPLRANLDADAASEIVQPEAVGKRWRLALIDQCQEKEQRYVLSPAYDFVDRLEVAEADGNAKAPELLYSLRNGAGNAGTVRIAKLDGPAKACPKPATLFTYTTARPTARPPAGYVLADFEVTVKENASRYAGREIRVVEQYAKGRSMLCCPSASRTTWFRLDPKKKAYVSYGTKLFGAR